MDVKNGRRELSKENINWIQNEAHTGEIMNGTVKNIKPFGAFVEVDNGVVGLLHIEDISVSRIKSPEERFEIGQNIKVMIKSIDKEQNRIELTHKELLGTWEENAKELNAGETVCGIVRSITDYGIFVELKPNLAGLAENKDGIEVGDVEPDIRNRVDRRIRRVEHRVARILVAVPVAGARRFLIDEAQVVTVDFVSHRLIVRLEIVIDTRSLAILRQYGEIHVRGEHIADRCKRNDAWVGARLTSSVHNIVDAVGRGAMNDAIIVDRFLSSSEFGLLR